MGIRLPPPLLTPAYQVTTATDSHKIAVTDSKWTGTGVQLFKTSDDGFITLTDSGLISKLGFTHALIVNLKPKTVDARCTLYTPYLKTSYLGDTTDNPEWNGIECFWNPVRKTYQTLLPYEVYQDNGMSKDDFLRAVNLYLGADTTNSRGITNNITWKFQKPTFTRPGIVGGIRVNETVDSSGESTYTLTLLQNEACYRDYPGTVSPGLKWLVYGMGFKELSDKLTDSTAEFPSVAAKQLTLLQIFGCTDKAQTTYDVDISDVMAADRMVDHEEIPYQDTLL